MGNLFNAEDAYSYFGYFTDMVNGFPIEKVKKLAQHDKDWKELLRLHNLDAKVYKAVIKPKFDIMCGYTAYHHAEVMNYHIKELRKWIKENKKDKFNIVIGGDNGSRGMNSYYNYTIQNQNGIKICDGYLFHCTDLRIGQGLYRYFPK